MKKTLLVAVIALLFTTSFAYGQAGTGTTTVSVTVAAEAALTVSTGTTTLTTTGFFANYTGTTNLTYYIRTTQTSGSGSLVLEVTTDFTGCSTGGPCVATPPTSGDALGYTCTVATPGNSGSATACTGTVNASTTAQTSVGTFAAGSSSLKAGNSASVAWALTDDPKYKTGTYTATVTFTISAS